MAAKKPSLTLAEIKQRMERSESFSITTKKQRAWVFNVSHVLKLNYLTRTRPDGKGFDVFIAPEIPAPK